MGGGKLDQVNPGNINSFRKIYGGMTAILKCKQFVNISLKASESKTGWEYFVLPFLDKDVFVIAGNATNADTTVD